MPRYASGSKAYGISDRSGRRYRLQSMRKEWNGLVVGPDEYEEKPASDYIHKKMLEAADKEDYELAEKMKEMYNRLKDIENNFKK